MRQFSNNCGTRRHTKHLSKRLRRAGPTIYQTTGDRMCPRLYMAARDITDTKLEHRNTDSKRSTGGNKYYKSKIGRKGGDARLKTLPKICPKTGSSLASTQRPYPRRSKTLEETPDALF